MRGRAFEVTWPEEDTSEALKAAYQGERDIELRTRLRSNASLGLGLVIQRQERVQTISESGTHQDLKLTETIGR